MPGSIHIALLAAGIIEDPFADRHELAAQWVDQQDWTLTRELVATSEDCEAPRQELLFDGIDTIATIRLNGRVLGRCVNMFRQVLIDCRGWLRRGRNQIQVQLDSPTRWAAAEARSRRMQGQVRPDEFLWQTGERRASWRTAIRKVQCHFGWDWGTYLATSGLWRPAMLSCSDAPRIASLGVLQRHHGPVGAPRRVTLTMQVGLVGAVAAAGTVVAVLMGGHMPKQDRRERKVISGAAQVALRRGDCSATLTLEVEDPVLWWPAHEGEQYLYYLSLHASDEHGHRSADSLYKIGLRTIEVVSTEDAAGDGTPGQGLLFQVNGRRIFAKGANWIPADQFIERCTPGVLRHLLSSMVESHMNMVRVWGGGWYEQEAFYDLCDELGLLVWQDFMMACGFYPDRPRFLAELREEVAYQVRRLAWRPSLALWCGDNENNTGVAHWWKQDGTQEQRLARYRKVILAVGDAVAKADTTRRFWPSSPCNGRIDAEPDAPGRGDIHYWHVWHGRQPFSAYLTVKPRFVSEFGFQSFPEPATLLHRIPERELNPSSRVMEHHQRSNDGNLLITNTMAREMRIPKDFDSFCWVSQINQAMAIRTAVEHWRRLKPWCMGALYWQLNDLWPVASWSSIDYDGRWKVLQHAAGRFFAPLLPSLVLQDGALEAWVTSDLPQELPLTARLELRRWSGSLVATRSFTARLPGQGSRAIARLPLARLLPAGVQAHQVCCFLMVKARAEGLPEREAENFATLVPWKWTDLEPPRLTTRLHAAAGAIELVVSSRTVTPFFHAELRGWEGHFAGDWQVLHPGRVYRLPWVAHAARGAGVPSLAQARAALRTLSLWDTFSHAPSGYEPAGTTRARGLARSTSPAR